MFTATINHPYNKYPPVTYRFDTWRDAKVYRMVAAYLEYQRRTESEAI